MIQTILHILARNMRLLDQQVELRSSDAIQLDYSKKTAEKPAEKHKASYFGDLPSVVESEDQQKTAETTAKRGDEAEKAKSKDQEKTKWDRNEKEKEETESSSSSLFDIEQKIQLDELLAKCFVGNKNTEKRKRKLAKLALIRKVYLHENYKNKSKKKTKGRADRYKDKEDLSLSSLDEKVDGTEVGKHLKEKEKQDKNLAKYRRKELEHLASSSSIMNNSSDDEENQKLIYEIERKKKERDTHIEPEKIAQIQKMHFQDKEREKAKVANMNDEERDIFLKDKEERKKAKERERYEKEKAKLEKFDNQQKTAEATAKGEDKAEKDKSKHQDKTEWDRNEKEKEETQSSSFLFDIEQKIQMDELLDKYFVEKENTEKSLKKLAKLTLIRNVYLHENNKRERKKKIKGRAARYKDKEDLSLSSLDEKVDGTKVGKHLKEKEKQEKKIAKYRKKESKYLASSSSSSSIMNNSSDDDENRKFIYEIERIDGNTEMEPEIKLAKIAQIRKMHFQDKEREKAKVANMNEEEREIFVKDKEERKKAKERKRYEKAKLENFDDKERKDHLISKEEKEKVKHDAEKNNKAGYKKKESLLDEEERKRANMNESEREKYLKKKKIEERETSKDRERNDSDIEKKIERKKYETEIPQLEKMNVEEKEKYLRDHEQKERAKLDAMDIDRTEGDKKKEREMEKDSKHKKKEESEKAKLGAKKIEKEHRDKEKESEENEKAKLVKMSDEEKEKYLGVKKQREQAKLSALDKELDTGREIDEKEKTNMTQMNKTEKEKYLKTMEKKEIKKSELGEFDRERGKREKEKLALMNETERERYLKQKEKTTLDAQDRADRDNEIESEENEKEITNLAKKKHDEKEKYLGEKEHREQAKLSALDKDITGREMDEKEKTKMAQMNKTEKEKYLKTMKKKEIKKSELGELDRERGKREKEKLALMNETERERYLKQKEKTTLDAQDRADRDNEIESEENEKEMANLAKKKHDEKEKYLGEKEHREQAKLSALDKDITGREMDEKEKTKMAQMNKTEREKYLKKKGKEERKTSELDALNTDQAEKESKRNLNEKEWAKGKAGSDTRTPHDAGSDTRTPHVAGSDTRTPHDAGRDTRTPHVAGRDTRTPHDAGRDTRTPHVAGSDTRTPHDAGSDTRTPHNAGRDTRTPHVAGRDTRTPHDDSQPRVGSIEVVTRSEFELLEAKVNELQEKTAPIPYPSMPDNQKLRTDLARGSASLTDTMQAMQVSSRVQATEAAMGRMADLLTQLAAAGALPQELVDQVGEVTAGMGRQPPGEVTAGMGRQPPGEALSRGELAGRGVGTSSSPQGGLAGRSLDTSPRDSDDHTRSVGTVIDERNRSIGTIMDQRTRTSRFGPDEATHTHSAGKSSTKTVGSGTQKYSGITTASRPQFLISPCVTHPELDDAQRNMKDEMMMRANNMIVRVLRLAEAADMNVRQVSEQMAIATNMSARIDVLFGLVNDYAEQLAGFDSGVAMQMQNFNEQMFQMRCELKDGIGMLTLAIANPETEAVRELNKKYEDMVIHQDEMKNTLHKLGYFQNGMNDDMMSLLKSVEALRATKADREELWDGFRDKANKKRLDGLLKVLDYEPVRNNMEQRLVNCYNKFENQDEVWTVAMEDLMNFATSKASFNQLFEFKYKKEIELNNIQDELHSLASAVGEPKAILLTRKISEGGTCGPCQAPARQEATADCQPPYLPAVVVKSPLTAEAPEHCILPVKLPRLLDEREHMCKRWAGGSHTLINKSVVHQEAGVHDIIRMYMPPTKKYTGMGKDGRFYQLEEVLQPCGDCYKPGLQEGTKVQNQPGLEEVAKVQNQPGVDEGAKAKEEGAGEPGVKKLQLNFD